MLYAVSDNPVSHGDLLLSSTYRHPFSPSFNNRSSNVEFVVSPHRKPPLTPPFRRFGKLLDSSVTWLTHDPKMSTLE